MHIAYLGDSTIGAKVNVGASTITSNYDGKKKHQTHIGDGVFVGSNSKLVPPIEISRDGKRDHAAGAENALAFGRARRTIKENWAKKDSAAGFSHTSIMLV